MRVFRGIVWLAAAAALWASVAVSAAVVTIYPGTKITPDGVEPAEWQLSNGWSIVTNKMGVGKITATGPSVCETPYEPFKAYELYNVAASSDFPRWTIIDESLVKQDLGRGAFYASCDRHYGYGVNSPTPSSVWLGTDQHGGRSLAGVKLKQITKMKYYALVTGVPSWLKPGASDAGWDSWKEGWYNPRFPIQLTLTVEGPAGRKQLWYRPWGNHVTIGDQASDGRLSVWEQYDCLNYGRWLCTGSVSWEQPVQFENWSEVLAAYGEYSLVSTSTGYDPANGQFKSVGWTDPNDPPHPIDGKDLVTDPPGSTTSTGTGKCLNFWVGARFYRLKRPDEDGYKTWYPESIGFRGQMDYFEFAVNYSTGPTPDIVDVTYDFEPAPEEPGPRLVYLSQSCLSHVNGADTLLRKRGEPESQYDPVANPLKNNKEDRLYDVLFKVSGRVTEKLNAYSVLDDGARLSIPTRVYMVLQNRWETPANPMGVGQYWSSWGLLERFRANGAAPLVTKPLIVWT